MNTRRQFLGGISIAGASAGLALAGVDLAHAQPRPRRSPKRDALLRSLNLDRSPTGLKGSHAASGLTFETHLENHRFSLTVGRRNGQSLDITGTESSIELTSRRAALRLTPRTSPEVMDTIREVLAIPAVQQFRWLTSELDLLNEPDTADSLTLAFPGAWMAVLDGDRTAIRRLHQRHLAVASLTASRPVAPMQPIANRLQMRDCWSEYSTAISSAWTSYEYCYSTAAQQWWNPYGTYFCAAEYLLRGESYWFQYLACSAYPF